MTFGTVADSLIRHGFARRVDVAEGLDLLAVARGRRLVQFGENVRSEVELHLQLLRVLLRGDDRGAAVRPAAPGPHHQLPAGLRRVRPAAAAAPASRACPVEAVALVSANDPPRDRRRGAPSSTRSVCLGCGVCVEACPRGAIALRPRPARVITPVGLGAPRRWSWRSSAASLAKLIFDTRSAGHRALAAILGVDPPPAAAQAGARQRAGQVTLPRAAARAAHGSARAVPGANESPGAVTPGPVEVTDTARVRAGGRARRAG